MNQADFYGVAHRTAEAALRSLLEKSLAAGLRSVVRCQTQERAAGLDDKLWTIPQGSFLPHALAGADCDDEQPILLSWSGQSHADSDLLFLMECPSFELEELGSFDRILYIFDRRIPVQLKTARTCWRTLSDTGTAMAFWSDDKNGWTRTAATDSATSKS